jgi:hypothetical protein
MFHQRHLCFAAHEFPSLRMYPAEIFFGRAGKNYFLSISGTEYDITRKRTTICDAIDFELDTEYSERFQTPNRFRSE